MLRDAFPADRYHRGRGLKAFAQNGGSVVAHFTDGGTAEADVLIGADGLRSTVRQQCLPAVAPLYAGYVAWRALVPESALPQEIHDQLFAAMTFCLPPGEQFLGYPVAGADNDLRAGQRRYNIVWYRPADEAKELAWLLTDDRGTTHVVSIPPPLIRRDAITGMRAAAERLLAPQLRAIVCLIEEPLLQPIYDLASPRLAFGRVAIIGDAAFVARPHVGAGVSKAADDAAALAEMLDADETSKTRCAVSRRGGCRKATASSSARGTLALICRRPKAPRSGHAPIGHRIPEAVLAETAVLDFLDG